MQTLGRHHMSLDQATERIERRADCAHRVGHRRQRDRRALQRVALGLAVQGLVLPELLEHDHRQQAGSRPGARYRVERRRRLADLLAVPAGELFPHSLDDLPPARLGFQRARHVLAELAQTIASAAFAGRRRVDHNALAWQVVGERVAFGGSARKAAHNRRPGDRPFGGKLIFRRARRQLLEGQRQLIDEPRRTFRFWAVDLALELGDTPGLLRDQRRILRRLRTRNRQFRFQGGVFFGKSVASGVHDTK